MENSLFAIHGMGCGGHQGLWAAIIITQSISTYEQPMFWVSAISLFKKKKSVYIYIPFNNKQVDEQWNKWCPVFCRFVLTDL